MHPKAAGFESIADHSVLEMSSSEATDFERVPPDSSSGFVKIGGPLPDSSDPRTIKGASSVPGNGHRLFYLRVIDSRKWHYSETFALFLDFFVQVLAISFTQKATFHDEVTAKASRLFSSGLMLCYFIDMSIRVLGLRLALFRSHSNIADLLCLVAMVFLLGSRFVMDEREYWLCLGYLTIVACRLILKPRARIFSKKLHKFRTNGDHIRISIESLRASLARIPGISAMSIEMMETDLVIICGRDEGDMTRDELMNFLERALHYRPPTLSATEFLSHLRDIDASSSTLAYGTTDVVRSTLWHWSTQMADLIFCFFVVCINASVSPALAIFLAKLSDAFDTLDSGNPNEATLRLGVMGVLALCVPFVLGDYAVGYFQSKMISKATESMQAALLNIILRQDTQFFAERSEGDLNNLFSSDVARVNALWQAVFWNLLNPLLAVVFGFGYALYMDASIGVMSFAFTAMLLSSGPQGFAAQRSKEFGSRNAYVAAEFQNAVGCEKVVRAYAIQDPLITRFKKTCGLLRKSQFSKDFWSSIVQIYIESAMYIFIAIMTASLAMKVWHKELSSGEFFGFITLLSRVSNPVTVLGGFMRVAIGNASSLQRVDDIIVGLGSSSSSKNDGDKDMPPLPKMTRDLRIEELAFKYDKSSENYILNELTATIPRGSYTCVVGPSGCGKSTLLACLMQFQEADGGCIRLDGHDIFNFSKKSFMDQTAVVFQDGGILNGTIYDNIRYGNISASNADCEEAARLAECHFIKNLKDSFETVVGQHATCNLSGGQAQRICLARALCRRPSLLLLDEATSALDPETEASIVATLERLSDKMNMTIISVTHRLSTALNADQILVLNAGRVAEEGRYEALVQKGGLFFEMVHKVEKPEEEEDDVPLEMSHMVSMAKSRRRGIVQRRNADTIGANGDEPTQMQDSALALQQFTKNLSSRVVHDAGDGNRSAGTTSWYRYGNRNSHRSRKTSDDAGNNAAEGGNPWYPTQNENRGGAATSEDERNKYFVL
ncbi:atp-binding cassette superfamily [Plasmopara halstedii]|uniref:Atp-binding cassette superfamily n=1 Tax=Plasmopara halstedii TaxID=4781 RepID=A0A0P1AZ33_PLAHL|nr:atp-binding cassette superfamily [Plasmopara halstedii]CEG46591.1 atp-binding cassette superfamily [Plasmopara halstedii]|eukprot:XP_024582960.1 atp-binding cassette superfamily [Plasmopara halstedii]